MSRPTDSTRADARTITIAVTFFADLRRFLPRGSEGPQRYTVPEGATAADLLAAIGVEPGAEVTIAVDGELGNRETPLRDGSGKLAVASLSGTNTIRLSVLGIDKSATRYGLALNYLALVPALLVESSAQVAGPYSIEVSASVEPGTRRITLPQNGGTRFYRLRWDHAVRITGITLAGGNIVLTYQ